jgi:hypothetical protein
MRVDGMNLPPRSDEPSHIQIFDAGAFVICQQCLEQVVVANVIIDLLAEGIVLCYECSEAMA